MRSWVLAALLLSLVESGPIWPIPNNLWKPLPGATSEKGNFVYLNSEPGDYVGGGQNYTYTPLNSLLAVTESFGLLAVTVQASVEWIGDVAVKTPLERGYYEGLTGYPYNKANVGGLYWQGNGHGCNGLLGWCAIDDVTYQSGKLTFISLRFEQRCQAQSPALRGALRWSINDHRQPEGPTKPPKGLWTPPKRVISSGNFFYLHSQKGDKVGEGHDYSYNSSNTLFTVSSSANNLYVVIDGIEQWSGNFQGMSSVQKLEKGYYGGLERYPFNNPAVGGLDWSGNGAGCEALSGWFVMDSIKFNATGVTEVKLRFAQYCEGSTKALYGAFAWSSTNPVIPLKPINPPPSNLWIPAIVPVSGNYVYLESGPDDIVGAGQNYTYTSSLSLSTDGNLLNVEVGEDWTGQFKGMQGLVQLELGYYRSLQRYPYNNPLLGGLFWSGGGRSCVLLSGWFVVDQIGYFSDGKLSAVTLRFQQQCRGYLTSLNGAINWKASTSSF